ncbi:hypothetical protein Pcinc_035077 [Petrolisthes cinctipes]|uniref:Uncharacterized protein n=1 Tax=Petrolisthes cinctipes TaxID=88211 RepID=A0AAE1C0H9_PETCI|nr:hypothetical protein Pcinc_035077 [Petrolisthes cinctipes]
MQAPSNPPCKHPPTPLASTLQPPMQAPSNPPCKHPPTPHASTLQPPMQAPSNPLDVRTGGVKSVLLCPSFKGRGAGGLGGDDRVEGRGGQHVKDDWRVMQRGGGVGWRCDGGGGVGTEIRSRSEGLGREEREDGGEKREGEERHEREWIGHSLHKKTKIGLMLGKMTKER